MTEADLLAIRQAIEQQIAAFQVNDAAAAFSQAAPSIQVEFGTAENFVRMVEAAYPPVYRPRSVVFEDLLRVEGLPAQQVMLMDQSGQLIRATYIMQQQRMGDWKIAGCYLTPIGYSEA
ncbi:MAG: hypothetical protein HLUCCA11_00885 [Phormidesmis priestleyi Ana]|uniref:DUF4864 domain-containing protein n=1 Tax=Phormidesmis priestleyi Ana TaxID=1666911 RepID=A0A0P8BU86_9CYAN|nr:MAG: hypothetical protein HLUCCA11_00885 [Phormidesmis priestleyi Ana]